jgi:fluoride ion exporter CrcB/FEX
MEFLFEILYGILQLFGEVILQLVFEFLVEFGARGAADAFQRRSPLHPVIAAISYGILGGLAGWLSLWIAPDSLIDREWLRLLNLFVTPIVAGGVMAWLGAWRAKRNQELIRLERFSFGFLFAAAMALVRYVWAV